MTVIFDDYDDDYSYLSTITLSNKRQEKDASSEVSNVIQSNETSRELDSSFCSIVNKNWHLNDKNFLKYSIQVVDDYEDDFACNKNDYSSRLSFNFNNSQLHLKPRYHLTRSNSRSSSYEITFNPFHPINNKINHIWTTMNSNKFLKIFFVFKSKMYLCLIEKFQLKKKVFSFWKWIESKLL